MTARKSALQSCYEKELKTRPAFGGAVTFRFAITPTGRPTNLEVDADLVEPEKLVTCLKSMVRAWVFPMRPPNEVEVAASVTMSPAR
jgi:hypothetical protein